ncbi:glycosyltransferase family 2 protein [Methylovirgula sp. 4M-Z18]|uniref:glycosyltransferase family 2 protein n=1 Tax=Methylovirgula sp. 4M-Z18 TaxID=2293567 RepID=UPI000E2F5B03|nr:glycosyltransferase family 2 protein [Methylovirgula sp. 4M-Z18]RFB81077.1 glycosyltransferase family 2 protein [Methylovirgula sp. 4M-Z18]
MMNASQIDVSVVIVNWNTIDLLRDCIDSVYSTISDVKFEIVVIDNGSTDGSVAMVRREFPDVILIANTRNVGFAAANNQGFAIALGRHILLLNSDTIVLDGAIQKTVAYSDAHPDTAALGCRVLNPDLSLQCSCFMFPSLLNAFLFSTYLYKLFPKSRFFGREQMTWWPRDDAREVDVVTGCYMLVRREAIDEAGVLDDGFFMYAEETDWCYRFRAKGWKNRFMPDAQIIHFGGASAVKLGARRAQIANASFVRYMRKHWSKPKALVGIYMLLLFYVIRLAALLPKRVVSADEVDKRKIANHWAGLKDICARSIHG